MNDKILPPSDAWKDFWAWIKQQPSWTVLGRKEKQYLDKTNRQMGEGTVKVARIQKLLDRYAPGRYEFVGGFIVRDAD